MAERKRLRTSVEELRGVRVFEGLPDWQLAWFCDNGEVREYEKGDVIIKDGSPAEELAIAVKGDVDLVANIGGQWVLVSTMPEGDAGGTLPYSRMTHYPMRGVATGHVRMLLVPKSEFSEMLRVSPEIGQRLVTTMSDRVRGQTRYQLQQEKLASLGKLSAGLAHELNNPSAAIQRSAAELRERIAALPARVASLMQHGLTAEQIESVSALHAGSESKTPLSALERSEREETVAAWLENHDVEDGWSVADVFVESGVTADALDAMAESVPEKALPDVLAWLGDSLTAQRMLSEINSSAGRIAGLVQSVKTYSHMDRSPEHKPTDVRVGLDSTLTMLGHKIKKKGVTLAREYDESLPDVQANSGELNQVWTNLIDNALDAVDEAGRIELHAKHDGSQINVMVIDNGPGIPEELQAKVFEPFFTTKDVGRGTGLGLDIVRRLVESHRGQITLKSKPGRTELCVRLPIAASG